MRLHEEVKLHTVADKSFIFARNGNVMDMTKIISFNNSSAWLWKQLEGREFTERDAYEILSTRYRLNEEEATTNLRMWITNLIKEGIITE